MGDFANEWKQYISDQLTRRVFVPNERTVTFKRICKTLDDSRRQAGRRDHKIIMKSSSTRQQESSRAYQLARILHSGYPFAVKVFDETSCRESYRDALLRDSFLFTADKATCLN